MHYAPSTNEHRVRTAQNFTVGQAFCKNCKKRHEHGFTGRNVGTGGWETIQVEEHMPDGVTNVPCGNRKFRCCVLLNGKCKNGKCSFETVCDNYEPVEFCLNGKRPLDECKHCLELLKYHKYCDACNGSGFLSQEIDMSDMILCKWCKGTQWKCTEQERARLTEACMK